MHHLVSEGLLSAEDHARFVTEVEQAAAQGTYFYGLTCFVYVGQALSIG